MRSGIGKSLHFDALENYDRLTHLGSFWSSIKSVNDPDQIWYSLYKGGAKQKDAVRLCQKFHMIYTTYRKRKRVILGSEEQKITRIVNYGRTLLNVWRALVLHFNNTVLACKRREDPANASQWDLRYKEGPYLKKGLEPAYKIIRVYHLNYQPLQTCANLRLSGRSETNVIIWAF